MKNGDLPAMPIELNGFGLYEPSAHLGLSKREQFAMAAMQGFLVNMGRNGINDVNKVAAHAVDAADALLAELERSK